MKNRVTLTCGLILLLGASLACDSRGSGDGLSPLPNSIADTSSRSPVRQIPTYGPPTGVDSARTHAARGQVLYIPVYSHIYPQTADRTLELATTVSIRNTSTTNGLTLDQLDYFDSAGTILRSYLDQPRRLGPLASTYVVIEERDRAGGVGANFVLTWRAEQPITAPVVEAIMLSTHSNQGISFVSQARVLQEW